MSRSSQFHTDVYAKVLDCLQRVQILIWAFKILFWSFYVNYCTLVDRKFHFVGRYPFSCCINVLLKFDVSVFYWEDLRVIGKQVSIAKSIGHMRGRWWVYRTGGVQEEILGGRHLWFQVSSLCYQLWQIVFYCRNSQPKRRGSIRPQQFDLIRWVIFLCGTLSKALEKTE